MEKQRSNWHSAQPDQESSAEDVVVTIAVPPGSLPSNAQTLDIAFKRAEASKAELLRGPDMLNGEELGRRLGVSRATVDVRRVAGKLLALEFGSKRGFRFPAWQGDLILDGNVRSTFEHALERLATVGQWSRYRFFTQRAPALNGMSPVQALLAGESDTVLRAAESWALGEQGGG